jgi:hypothetical protein
MNILKILSNKSWGLSAKTLNNVYNSLIRSLLEYSSIIYPAFSDTNLLKLERIQFRSHKIMHRLSKYDSNEYIKAQPEFIPIQIRFDSLNVKYLTDSLRNKNELKTDLYSDYTQYSESRELERTTLFCKYRI